MPEAESTCLAQPARTSAAEIEISALSGFEPADHEPQMQGELVRGAPGRGARQLGVHAIELAAQPGIEPAPSGRQHVDVFVGHLARPQRG
ncbi:MAG: hypothetical protein WKF64_11160 [Ilumatobacteraceae bacterium]